MPIYLCALLFWIIGSHYFQRLIVSYIAQSIAVIRLRLLDELQRLSLRAYESAVLREEVYTTLEYDIEEIAHALTVIARTVHAGVVIISCLFYLLFISQTIFIFTLTLILIGLLVYLYIYQLHSQATDQRRNEETRFFDSQHHLLHGFRELKLDPRRLSDFFHNNFLAQIERVQNWRLICDRLIVFLQILAMLNLNLLFCGLLLIIPWYPDLNPEVVLKSVGIVLLMPWEVLLDGINRIGHAHISLMRQIEFEHRLQSLPQEPPPDPQSYPRLPPPRETLFGQQLRFSYYDAWHEPTFTLGPLDITLHIGKIHFISGPNGSGKTTLMKLLAGLYPTAEGQICVDGLPVAALDLRHYFAVVFADAHIFDRLYGLEEESSQRVQEWLERMDLASKTRYEHGRFTEIRLSTGQRKRLALIVALLWERPLLICDEWTCEQDPHFREFFYRELLPQLRTQGKTVIAVTHDEDYYSLADYHYQLRDGQLQSLT